MSVNLWQLHFEEGNRQHSLFIGVAASAIAFAMHETSSRTWDLSLIVTAGAVVSWAISFGFGIRSSQLKQQALQININLQTVTSGNQVDHGGVAETAFAAAVKRLGAAGRNQLICLLAGAVLYSIGHGIHIYDNGNMPADAVTDSVKIQNGEIRSTRRLSPAENAR